MNPEKIEQKLETEYHISWFIIAYKMIFGLAELLTGLGLAIYGHKMFALYSRVVTQELSEEPHDLLARLSEHVVPNIFTHNTFLLVYLMLLGLVKIAGAVGLIYKKHWGVDLLVALTLIMFPFQLMHILHRPSSVEIIYVVVGLFIALYLVNFHPKEWATRVTRTIRKTHENYHGL